MVLTVLVSALSISASAAEDKWLYYENDFSNAATLADFKQYRGNWEIKDGVLQVASEKTGFEDTGAIWTWVMFDTEDKLTDYIIEVDMLNHQTSSGILFRNDITKTTEDSNDSYYGYKAFLSNDSTKGALGWGNDQGAYGSNFDGSVKGLGVGVGANVHLKIEVKGKNITYTITNLDTNAEIYTFTCEDEHWANGTFGLDARLSNGANKTIGNLKFDNLKVYTTDKNWKPATPPPVTPPPATGDATWILAAVMVASVVGCVVTVSKKKAK